MFDIKHSIRIYDFLTQEETHIPMHAVDGVIGGHGGGDAGIVNSTYDFLTTNIQSKSIPSVEESCHNHILVFAAEESRLTNKVVDIDEYIETVISVN